MTWNKIVYGVAVLAGVVVFVWQGWKLFEDAYFTEATKMDAVVVLATGGTLEVDVTKHQRGFYVDGGHGWSLGSPETSYEVSFLQGTRKGTWVGKGVPLIFQEKQGLFYLACYERQTRQTEFKCYRWNDAWREIPLGDFPKELALNNLLQIDSESHDFGGVRFGRSLLAKFWYCLSNPIQEWQLSEDPISPEFILEYRRQWLKK